MGKLPIVWRRMSLGSVLSLDHDGDRVDDRSMKASSTHATDHSLRGANKFRNGICESWTRMSSHSRSWLMTFLEWSLFNIGLSLKQITLNTIEPEILTTSLLEWPNQRSQIMLNDRIEKYPCIKRCIQKNFIGCQIAYAKYFITSKKLIDIVATEFRNPGARENQFTNGSSPRVSYWSQSCRHIHGPWFI